MKQEGKPLYIRSTISKWKIRCQILLLVYYSYMLSLFFFTIQALKRNVKLSEKTGRPKSWRFNEETIMPVLDVI